MDRMSLKAPDIQILQFLVIYRYFRGSYSPLPHNTSVSCSVHLPPGPEADLVFLWDTVYLGRSSNIHPHWGVSTWLTGTPLL